MKQRSLLEQKSLIFVVAMLAFQSSALADVVINEVMARPLNQSTNGSYEFIELYNTGNVAVDIGGYILTDSSDTANMCDDPLPTSTSDNEGFIVFPENTIVPANGYLTLWSNFITGVTDQPNHFVYGNVTAHVSNIVLLDSGDQVTILRCVNGVPTVVDSLDLSAWGDTSTGHNISWERVSATETTQLSTNWKKHRAVSSSSVSYAGYLPGGTPGALNTNSCATGYAYHDGACVLGYDHLVGIYNQMDYDENWPNGGISSRSHGGAQKQGFIDYIDGGNVDVVFDRNLENNAQLQLEDSELNLLANDVNGLDSVDVAFIGTHGSIDSTLIMYEANNRADIKKMILGDDARGLSLLILWACDTLAEEDSSGRTRFVRWANAFSGELRYVAGFRGNHIRSITTNEDGRILAQKLKDGYTIKMSLEDSQSDWLLDLGDFVFGTDNNEPTVAASGRNASDCERRLNNMELDDLVGTERLRGNQVGTLCFYDIVETLF